MLPEKTNYLYYVGLVTSVVGFFSLLIGVFWNSWFVLQNEDGRVLEIYNLFDDLTCFENYCVPADISVQHQGSGWLLVIKALFVFNVIFLLMGVVLQINHASLPRMQAELFVSCVVLLGTSIFVTVVSTTLLCLRIRAFSTHKHAESLPVLNLQSTPLIILLLSIPCSLVSIALLVHGSVFSKQKPALTSARSAGRYQPSLTSARNTDRY